jgi:hypothetical protein
MSEPDLALSHLGPLKDSIKPTAYQGGRYSRLESMITVNEQRLRKNEGVVYLCSKGR